MLLVRKSSGSDLPAAPPPFFVAPLPLAEPGGCKKLVADALRSLSSVLDDDDDEDDDDDAGGGGAG